MTFQQVPASAAEDSANAGPCFATANLGDPHLGLSAVCGELE